jgi:Ca-activated chloride channel family protein
MRIRLALPLIMASILSGCAGAPPDRTAYLPVAPTAPPPPPPPPPIAMMAMRAPEAPPMDTERYSDVPLNSVKQVAVEPVATFSADVDTASYANMRRFIEGGSLPPSDAVRTEELVNYFTYGYPLPTSPDKPFAADLDLVPSPWADGRLLMRIGLQGYKLVQTEKPPINLTLLIDVSGSMSAPDKLPLAKKGLDLLIRDLGADDSVAIVVYAGAAGEVLPPTSGADKARILSALDSLSAGGSTAGGEGIQLAYRLARQNFSPDKVNRVMLLTDGDFNVGVTDDERLEDVIARERESGIYLSIVGFGTGNYNDALMQTLAQSGNGTASYVDSLSEARKVFIEDLSGNLFPIANDVKIQVEFNPARVLEYRLIGYETRLLNREDFNNDKADAGEVGSGHSVTALFELVSTENGRPWSDPLRYQQPPLTSASAGTEFANVKIRYKLPGQQTSELIERPVTVSNLRPSITRSAEATRWAAAVAGFAGILKNDPNIAAGFTLDDVISLASGARGEDPYGHRAEFVQIVRTARDIERSNTPLDR